MASLRSLSEDGLKSLFGTDVELTVYDKRLEAAKLFRKIRDNMEINTKKLSTLKLADYHRSTKKALVKSTLEKARAEGIENHVILSLVSGLTKAEAFNMIILCSYSIRPSEFEQLRNSELLSVLPHLREGLKKELILDSGLRTYFEDAIETALGTTLLNVINDSHQQTQQSQEPTLPMILRGFRYQTANIHGIDVVLKGSMLHSAVKTSLGWRTERFMHTEDSNSLWVDVPATYGDDIVFHITTSWDEGWNIVQALAFKSAFQY
ncbi:unnamed protein product [Clonostachys rosea f. rosea IK726]|uniref:Uncharacterized protein n=1 Tax=Clonostachys rosea f. rosea IK726 TaxID=1349383 RepID=A0ACA9TFP9_BIOOC|nr:unnamed protein product [Clonostachys rosea f. rosea IK726]